MKCYNCKHKKVYLDAFATGICRLCGNSIVSFKVPGNKICFECSTNYKKCEICGKDMKEDIHD